MKNDYLNDMETSQQKLGGIARTTLFELMRSGQIGSIKVGRRRMIPQSQIDSFIEARTKTTVGSLKSA